MIEKIKSQWKSHGGLILELIAIFSVVILINEFMLRRNIIKAFEWTIKNPDLFLMNLATILLVFSALMLFFKRIRFLTSVFVSIIIILGAINSAKYSLRNIPLSVGDALLIKEVWALRDQIVNAKFLIGIFVLIIGIVIISIAMMKLIKYSKISEHRFVFISIIAVSGLVLGIGQIAYDSNYGVMKTGFIYQLSNFTRIKPLFDDAYIEKANLKIIEAIEGYESGEAILSNDVKPNVIIIQSEAFWDVNKLGLKMDKNPIENFYSLKAESIYGELYVPVIGGGTVNPEYEILTGMTLKNYNSDWFMVYPNEIKAPIPSLASIFKKHGYKSLSLHPYMSWYYNRIDVYRYLGFDEFKSIEYMDSPEMMGAYVSDKYITDEIIKSIEDYDEPIFNFVVTMQNHGPYGNSRFLEDQFTINIETELSYDSNFFLKNYVQGLYYTDLELKRLVDYLRNIEEPTVILFFGDHLPMLGDDYLAYRESGFVGDENSATLQQDIKMMTVPYIIWANYSNHSEELTTMNISYLSAFLLELLGFEMPDYMKVVASLGREMPLLFRSFGIGSDGREYSPADGEYILTKAIYYLLHKHWTDGEYDSRIAEWIDYENLDYNKALNQIYISNLEKTSKGVILKGDNFYQNMRIFLNEKPISFEYIDSNSVLVNESLKTQDLIKITLENDNGKLITQSNIFMVDTLN